MTNNEESLNLDITTPDSNLPKQQPTKDAKSEFGRKPDIVLDPATVRSSMTSEEVTQAVDPSLQVEAVDDQEK